MQQLPYRVGIDARLAGKKHAGIGRYIENLLLRLPKIAPEVSFTYFFYDQEQASDVLQHQTFSNVSVELVPIRHYSLKEQLECPKYFRRQNLDLLHVPHFNVPILYRQKIVITIHDLLWHEYQGPEVTTLSPWQYCLKHQVYFIVVAQAMKRARGIFVPTETIKKTVMKYYPFTRNKIVVTKEGVSTAYQLQSLTQHTIKKQLVYVGSLYPHKNIRIVIDALKELPDYTLLLAGTRTVFQEDIAAYVKEKKLEDRVHFLGYQSDESLLSLYAESFALVQPSLSEGFGLTGVEAMSAGIPVIASSIPIFQEIYRGAAFYFDSSSIESFCTAVKTLEISNRQASIEAGQKIAKTYSWDTMAQDTLSTYIKLLAT